MFYLSGKLAKGLVKGMGEIAKFIPGKETVEWLKLIKHGNSGHPLVAINHLSRSISKLEESIKNENNEQKKKRLEQECNKLKEELKKAQDKNEKLLSSESELDKELRGVFDDINTLKNSINSSSDKDLFKMYFDIADNLAKQGNSTNNQFKQTVEKVKYEWSGWGGLKSKVDKATETLKQTNDLEKHLALFKKYQEDLQIRNQRYGKHKKQIEKFLDLCKDFIEQQEKHRKSKEILESFATSGEILDRMNKLSRIIFGSNSQKYQKCEEMINSLRSAHLNTSITENLKKFVRNATSTYETENQSYKEKKLLDHYSKLLYEAKNSISNYSLSVTTSVKKFWGKYLKQKTSFDIDKYFLLDTLKYYFAAISIFGKRPLLESIIKCKVDDLLAKLNARISAIGTIFDK